MTKEIMDKFQETLSAIKRKDDKIYDQTVRPFDGVVKTNKTMKETAPTTDSRDDAADAPSVDPDLPLAEQKNLLIAKLMGSGPATGDIFTEVSDVDNDDPDPDRFMTDLVKPLSSAPKEATITSERVMLNTVDEPESDDEGMCSVVDGERLGKKEMRAATKFRHEEFGSDRLRTFARNSTDTLRKKNEKRKEKRQRRKELKEAERHAQVEALRATRKSKRGELVQRLKEMAAEGDIDLACASHPIFAELGDVSLEEMDGIMKDVFDDGYYGDEKGEEDVDMGEEEKEADGDDVEEEKPRGKSAWMHPATKGELDGMLAELYSVEHEDVIDDTRCRFHYMPVAKDSFGMTTQEILEAEDERALNKKVPLALLAPYAAKGDRDVAEHIERMEQSRKVREKAAKRREKIKEGKMMVQTKAKRLGDGTKISAARMAAYGDVTQRKRKDKTKRD